MNEIRSGVEMLPVRKISTQLAFIQGFVDRKTNIFESSTTPKISDIPEELQQLFIDHASGDPNSLNRKLKQLGLSLLYNIQEGETHL